MRRTAQEPSLGENTKKNRVIPVYPLLVGVYPALALAALNISQIDLAAVYRSLALSAALALLLLGALRLVLRSWQRAALLTLLLLILFFFYGHIYNLLKTTSVFGFLIGRHRSLLVVWAGLAGLSAWFATRKWLDLAAAARALNIISALLLVFPIWQIGAYEIFHAVRQPARDPAAAQAPVQAASQAVYPDIYYIILDGYGRADTLQAVFDYDNSDFLAALAERGFYVADCSMANYGYTDMSLGTSLNLDYLDQLISNPMKAADLLPQNRARQFLTDQGYTIVAFETGFRWSQWADADVYIKFRRSSTAVNNFEGIFLGTTLLRIPIDFQAQAEAAKAPITFGSIHHDLILYNLGSLKSIPATIRSPKFVFAHLVIPHAPYVFTPTGELAPEDPSEAGQIEGYRNGVLFINSEVLKIVDAIQADSETPPVIILQGDHGPYTFDTPAQHMGILNAYYLPGGSDVLYPSISPVNSFRVIFNTVFGQDYPLLPDVSWFSPLDGQYKLEKIENLCGK